MRTLILCMAVFALLTGVSLGQTDGRLGEVRKIDKASGEILVSLPASRNDVKVGDLLYAMVNGEYVTLRAVFPMQTVVKCRAEGKNRALLTSPGAPVFRTMKAADGGTSAPADPAKGKYEVGGKGPAGGYVFYDKGSYSDGWRYLEAAPEDITLTAAWHNNGENVETGAVGTAIGTGRDNTKKIIAAQGAGVYAAKLCADYKGGGKNDWFLPSKDELDMMYMKLKKTGIVDFSGRFAWTSSEDGKKEAYFQAFMFGYQSSTIKSDQGRVRAVRAF